MVQHTEQWHNESSVTVYTITLTSVSTNTEAVTALHLGRTGKPNV